MFKKIIKGLKDVWCGTLEFDTEPKKDSFNPVTSGGVYDAINGAGAKEIVYFDVDPSDPPSGIYEEIGEALANNKEPVIKNEGAVYFYSSTGTDKYVFVGGYDTDVVKYTTVTVSDDDSVVKETVDTIEGMVFPLYYHSNDEGFTVADKTGHALTKTEIADAYRAGQIFMFSSYPASNTQAHWGYCCDINIESDNTGYAEFFILAAFGGDSYEWEKYRINLSSGTEFVTLWGPNTSYSTGYSGSYASASDVTALQSQVSSLSDVSAYTVKGEATVAQLNAGPSGIQAGWAYQLTDSGTLTDGTLAVVAGDTVAWDGTKWFPLVKSNYYATKTYAQNVAHSIAPEYNGTTGAVADKLYMHEGSLYLCKENTSGDWNSSKFTAVKVCDELYKLYALQSRFTTNDGLNAVIKELYIDPNDIATIQPQAITKCRVFNGYNGLYGLNFYDSSNSSKLPMYSENDAVIRNYRRSYALVDLSSVPEGTYRDFENTNLRDLYNHIDFSPSISEYLYKSFEAVNFTSLYIANAYVKELYLDPSDVSDADLARIAKVRIYNGYNSRYGVNFADSEGNIIFNLYTSTESTLQISSKSGVALDYRALTNSTYRDYECTLDVSKVRNLSLSSSVKSEFENRTLTTNLNRVSGAIKKFTDNDELNAVIKELFIDPSDVSYVQPDTLVRCRVFNGYLIGSVAQYGAVFYDSSNSAKLELYSVTNSPIQKFRASFGVFDLSKVASGLYKDYAMSLTSICVHPEFSPYIKEYVTRERLAVIFTDNDKANAYVKELYIDPSDMTDANIANVAKIRVYNGYAGNRHGITLVDSSNNTLFSIINTTGNSSLQTVSKSGVVLDYLSLGNSGYKEISCALVARNVRNVNLSPSLKCAFDYAELADKSSKKWFDDSLLCPDYTPQNNTRPVVYEGDTKSNSNYVVNAVSYPDGSMIVCRRGGVVAKVATDGTETTLMTISHASDWRLCWMDSNLNVYVSPHSSVDNGGSEIDVSTRGLYKLAYGESQFVKVISLYDSTSSVTTETQNNDDTIWTMCEDNDGNLYAGVYAHTIRANPAIYKSTDGGDTWEYVYNFATSGLASSGKHIHDIIFNEYNNKLYCIVGEINEIYCSDDGSETWAGIGAQVEDYKGTVLMAVPDGLLVGSDGAYACILSKVYADGKVRTKGKIWANTVFALRRSDSSNAIYAFTKIDSSVSSTSYFPPSSAITDPSALETWKEGSPTYLADWTKYNEWAKTRYPEDAIRPQHVAIMVSRDDGESWAIMHKFETGSAAAFGFWTIGQFRNGECLAGFVGAGPAFAKPKVISEGKHKYGSSGLDLEGDIFVKLNSSSVVTQL